VSVQGCYFLFLVSAVYITATACYIYLFTYLFVHSFIHSFICSFVLGLIKSLNPQHYIASQVRMISE